MTSPKTLLKTEQENYGFNIACLNVYETEQIKNLLAPLYANTETQMIEMPPEIIRTADSMKTPNDINLTRRHVVFCGFFF